MKALLLAQALTCACAALVTSPLRRPLPAWAGRGGCPEACLDEAASAAPVLISEEGEAAARFGLSHVIKEDALLLMDAASLLDDCQLSLTLCDDPFIHSLNKQWRNVDRPTDVLSFPLDDEHLLGDLVISVDTAQRQADERGHEIQDEIRVLMVHGLLHLLGYDHEVDEAEHAEMASAEQRLLRKVGWRGDGLIALADES
jgi:rRNA maturation RNase YbeY